MATSPPTERVAWLIEGRRGGTPIWACHLPIDPEWLCWEHDANKAIKFRTEQDAQAFIDERKLGSCKPTEHAWFAPEPAAEPDGLPAFYTVTKCSQCGHERERIERDGCPESCGRTTPTKGASHGEG